VNLAMWVARNGGTVGDKPATAYGDKVVHTYAEMADRVSRIAGGLRQGIGMAEGDRVALLMKNCPEYMECMFGAWHGGLVAVPINAKLHPSEFKYIIENSGSKICIATADLADAIRGTNIDGLERVIILGDTDHAALLAADPIKMVETDADDLAWLFYTSGTTGRPKGAMLSHRNLAVCSWCYLADVDPYAPWSAMLHAAPISHGAGLYGLAHIMKGSCQVIPESGGFEPQEIFELIKAWPNLAFFAAPTMVKRMLMSPIDSDTSNLKAVIYGGGPMYVEDILQAMDRFGNKFTQLYGQGEAPMTITSLNQDFHAMRDHPRYLERLGSVGRSMSGLLVRTANEDDVTLPPGEIGEILVKGDIVMKGYWRNPEATEAALRGGWLHTGDVGTFDEDGFLTLKDRSKDMIISGGTNIYPREVEEVLLRHPGVAEVSVIGRPDPEWGEVVVAYVVAEDAEKATPKELDALCLEQVARFKRPKDYRYVDSLPKNNYGKVLKTELRDRDAKEAR
jgi:long-chain acyl-CoA synthetase